MIRSMNKRLVLVGGGHAHLTVLKHLDQVADKCHSVTLISPTTHHYYSGMGPGLISGIYRPQDVRFHVKKMAEDRGAEFVLGKVVRVDPENRLLETDTEEKVEYDIVSFNTGSQVSEEGISETAKNLFPVKPIENLLMARKAIMERINVEDLRLAVVGGGPAGLELAGNLRQLMIENDGSARITLFAGSRLLGSFPEKVRKFAYQAMSDSQIAVVEGDRVKRINGGQLITADGREYSADCILLAWGIKPSRLFKDSGMPTDPAGGLLVNEYLQSVKYPEVFGGGDCIGFQQKPLDKVGVHAVTENPILYHNLLAAMAGGEMKPFVPQDRYLLIFNVGGGKGIFWKQNWIWRGRLAFYIKDYIDRKFMREFQVSGEQIEAEAV